MEEIFDKILAEKIKDVVQSHIEPYRDGAWENFLSKKKKRKQRVLYWLIGGTAASLVILFSLGILLYNSPAIPIDKHTPQITNEIKNEIEKDNPPSKDDSGASQQSLVEGTTTDGGDREPSAVINKSDDSDLDANDRYLEKLRFTTSGIKMHKSGITSRFDLDSLRNTDDASIVMEDALDELLSTTDDKKATRKQSMQLAFQLAPSLGAGDQGSTTSKMQNFGAGALVDIPLKSNFSINSGILFNALKHSNDDSFILNSNGTEEKEIQTKTNFETSQFNLDIPVNLVYTFPSKKNNIYFLSGLSSYITLKESQTQTTETIREVVVFREVNGVLESFREKESVLSSNSSQVAGGRFIPFATINLSVGYRTNLADKVNYDIQPFFKIPIQELVSEDLKIPMAGVALKIVLKN
nr:hypothetical protein [Allomuricauda sp.]